MLRVGMGGYLIVVVSSFELGLFGWSGEGFLFEWPVFSPMWSASSSSLQTVPQYCEIYPIPPPSSAVEPWIPGVDCTHVATILLDPECPFQQTPFDYTF